MNSEVENAKSIVGLWLAEEPHPARLDPDCRGGLTRHGGLLGHRGALQELGERDPWGSCTDASANDSPTPSRLRGPSPRLPRDNNNGPWDVYPPIGLRG